MLRSVATKLVTAMLARLSLPDGRSEPADPTAMDRLVICSAWGSDVVAPLAQALRELGAGPLRWLASGDPAAQLLPGSELLLALANDQELVDWVDFLASNHQACLLALPHGARLRAEAALHHALLDRAGVPLLGLLQVGGDWDPAERRADGLPWLGHWTTGDLQGLEDLLPLLRIRWRHLDLPEA
jgi:hypothetical protein